MKNILFFFLISFTISACSEDPRCNDGVLNGDEMSIDCGGKCDPCYTCNDGILNQGEFDIDCGGPCPTCDGLSSWEALDLPGEKHHQLHFFNEFDGILLTETKLWKTTDQGDNWAAVNTPSSIGHFYWMKVISDQLAFALVIESGIANYRLYKITDQFNTWEAFGLNLPTTDPNFRSIFDIDAKDENNILVSHEYDHGQVYLSRTTDGGNNWDIIFESQEIYPFNLDFIAGLQYNLDNTIYAFHERDQLISNDNGDTWTKREMPFDINLSYSIDNINYNPRIYFSDADNAIFNSSSFNGIWLTNDGGNSWTKSVIPDLQLTNWLPIDYLKLGNGRILMTATLTCLSLQNGYCSIAWISDEQGLNWDRYGITPSLGSIPWDGLVARTPYYFDQVSYAFDPFSGKLLRLL